jgi:hypothetical protein
LIFMLAHDPRDIGGGVRLGDGRDLGRHHLLGRLAVGASVIPGKLRFVDEQRLPPAPVRVVDLAAAAWTIRSLSLMMPTRAPCASTTGTPLMRLLQSVRATSRIEVSGETVVRVRVMMSATMAMCVPPGSIQQSLVFGHGRLTAASAGVGTPNLRSSSCTTVTSGAISMGRPRSVLEAENAEHRTEDFLLDDLHLLMRVGEQRWGDKVVPIAVRAAAEGHRRALLRSVSM